MTGIELATGIVPTYPRHPVEMARQALTVQAACGERFTLGIGVSHHHIVEGEHCASLFDLDTIHGVIPVLDRFRVVNGQLKVANPFYDPTPLLSAAAPKE